MRKLKTRIYGAKNYTLLSLFTGAGALDYGFESIGRFITKASIESEGIFCETIKKNQHTGNLASATIINNAIENLNPKSIMHEYFNGLSPDGIIGGPPCESFSSMGKQKALSDPRGQLIFKFCDWVRELRPRFFLFENVPHLAYRYEGKILRELLETFNLIGYSVNHQIMNASHYGAATKRKRLIIVGILNGAQYKFPKPTHGEPGNSLGLQKFKTSGEALDGLPEPFDTSELHPTWHKRINHTKCVIERFAKLLPGQQDKIRKRWRLSLNHPSPSLIAGNLQGIRSHIHPTEPRELTNRESARIHGFDDKFDFCGNHAAVGKQIANSVPIPLALTLANTLAEHLDGGKVPK